MCFGKRDTFGTCMPSIVDHGQRAYNEKRPSFHIVNIKANASGGHKAPNGQSLFPNSYCRRLPTRCRAA